MLAKSQREILSGKIDVESGLSTTIRTARGPSLDLRPELDFLPVMADLRKVLTEVKEKIAIEAHGRYSDHHALPFQLGSVRRACPVRGSRAVQGCGINAERFMVVGYAETQPLAPNDDGRRHQPRGD